MKSRATLAAVVALGATAFTVPALAGPQDRALPPTAVVPRPVVVDADPAHVTYSRQARSQWQLTDFDRGENSILATHTPSGIMIAIDYDDPGDDRHAAGISPDTGCGPMEGEFWGSITPLFYPILEPDTQVIEDVSIAIDGTALRVRMSGGSYDMVSEGAGDEPLFMDAELTVEDGRLRAHTSGLHYVLPSKDPGTTVDLTLADGSELSRTFTTGTPTGREYVDDVRVVEVADARYGDFSWTTDIERLQFDVNTSPLLDVFEIDADHTLKDLGQRIVTNDFTFASDCG
jgi:hypothetical protein